MEARKGGDMASAMAAAQGNFFYFLSLNTYNSCCNHLNTITSFSAAREEVKKKREEAAAKKK